MKKISLSSRKMRFPFNSMKEVVVLYEKKENQQPFFFGKYQSRCKYQTRFSRTLASIVLISILVSSCAIEKEKFSFSSRNQKRVSVDFCHSLHFNALRYFAPKPISHITMPLYVVIHADCGHMCVTAYAVYALRGEGTSLMVFFPSQPYQNIAKGEMAPRVAFF